MIKKDWRTKHSMSRTRFYGVYRDMKQRCNYEKDKQYNLYGGRGIKCEWNSFLDFKKDMYKSYIKHKKKYPEYRNTSIDRINNNGNYCKENCRWATHKIQQCNKSTTAYITYNGVTKTRQEWSKITGIPNYSIYNRIKRGHTLDQVFCTPKGKWTKNMV